VAVTELRLELIYLLVIGALVVPVILYFHGLI